MQEGGFGERLKEIVNGLMFVSKELNSQGNLIGEHEAIIPPRL